MTQNLKRLTAFFLVLVMCVGMFPTVMAAELEETLTTEPEESATAPPETEATEETSSSEETVLEETFPEDAEASLMIMSLDDGIATVAETEIVGAPNAFATLFLLNGGVDIPSFDHVQHKEHIPLYSVYLKNQPGYENNYYVAYCIEPGVVLGNSGGHAGSSTTIGGMTDGTGALTNLTRLQVSAMGVALLYGQKEIARRADEESVRLEKLRHHAATQVIIWEIASGMRSSVPPYTRSDSTLYDAICPELEIASDVWNTKFYIDGIDEAYNEIVAQMAQHYVIPSFASDELSFASTYELTPDSSGKYSVTLTDTNNILSKYAFTNTDQLTFKVSGNKLTITANGPISETVVAPTKQVPSLDDQVFYVWEYKKQQKLMSCKSEPTNDPVPAYFKVSASSGSLSLTKTTEDGNNLAGWQFGIYADQNCTTLISGPHETDANGSIAVSNLSAGTVWVKEIGHKDSAVNALYQCDSANPQNVTITAGKTATVSFHNRLNVGDVKLVKTTNTGENLSGWKIGLFYDEACTQSVSGSPFTTGEDGTITVSGLKPGVLYAKEEPVDDPCWACDTEVKKVTVVASQTATVTFRNTHYGSLEFRKTTNTGTKLEGWTFRVTDSDGNHVGDYITDSTGYTCTELLLPGRYYVQELSTDDPYWVCDLTTHVLDVTAGKTVGDSWTNIERGMGVFHKSTNTGEDLEGWEITVFTDEGCTNAVATLLTGADGSVSCMFEPGQYFAKETGDSYGRFDDAFWSIDSSVQAFEIKAHEDTAVSFSNTHFGKIQIVKTMDTDGPLDGWKFRVTDSDGNEIPGSPFTSRSDGTILTGNILPGNYTIEELLQEDSLYYCKTENPQTVTVKQGEVARVKFTNALRPGKISIEKVDIYGEPLAGAKFLLEWSEDGATWNPVFYSDKADVVKGGCSNPDVVDGSLITTETGLIEWGNLYPSLYYRVTELEAPEGYSLLTKSAYEGQLPVDDLTVSLRVINTAIFTLPQTGSKSLVLMPVSIGLCLAVCVGAIWYLRKKEE